MSRAAMICLFSAILLMTCACSARADQPPNVIAAKLYDQVDQAWINRDANQLLTLYDPDSFVSIDEHGTRRTFAQVRGDFQEFFGHLRNVHANSVVKDAQLQAGRLVVYIKSETHFEFHAKDGKSAAEIRNLSAEETWAQKGGQWKLVQAKTLKSEMILDPEWVAAQRKMIEDLRPCVYSSHGC
jgi:ketosteroid isomerase-like protein